MFEQLSLFGGDNAIARSCMDGRTAPAKRPEPWMVKLVPQGEYVVNVGQHPLVLKPTPLQEAQIPEGHHYYHYVVGGQVYAGTFVGEY